MTVASEINHNQYVGNGVTTSFDYGFRIFKNSHLLVQVSDLDGVITPLVLGTDYTVTGVGASGGKVVLTVPLATGWAISIDRNLPIVQETDLRNQGTFYAETHEDAFDYLTMLIQRVFSSFGLALKKPSWIAKFYDALGNRIDNLADPIKPQDAATKSYTDSQYGKTLRFSSDSVQPLPPLAQMEGKILAFSGGKPIGVLPASGSASEVLIALASYSGSKYIGICPSIADLKNVVASAGERVQVKGYRAFTNLGGGDFVYVETIPAGWLDEGVFIKSAALPGYWARLGDPNGMDLYNWGLSNNPDPQVGISDLGEVLNRAMIHNNNPVIPAGEWLMSSVARIPSGTWLKGMGYETTIVRRVTNGNAMFMNDADGVTGGWEASSNIRVSDFHINADMDNFPSACTPLTTGHANNIRIHDMKISNVPGRWHAIELNATYNAVIEKCHFVTGGLDQYEGECIQLDAAIAGGPFPWFGPYDQTVCSDIIVRNNRFENWSCAIGSHSGVTGSRWIGLKILDNAMYVSKAGIKLIGWSGVLIRGNRILYAKSTGYPDTAKFYPIILQPSANVINSDVLISHNQVVWEMNGVTGSDHRGIQVKGNGTDATGTLKNVTISDNIVRGSFRTHISADDIIDVKIIGNTVEQIGTYSSGASNFAGIALYGTRNGTVSNNTVLSAFHIVLSRGSQTINMERAIVNSNNVSGNIGIDNEFLNQVVIGNICQAISAGTKLLAARGVGKYRSQTVVCLGNVETNIATEAQITAV